MKVVKTYYHYLKNCKDDIFVFIEHNIVYQFIDIKILSSYQIY